VSTLSAPASPVSAAPSASPAPPPTAAPVLPRVVGDCLIGPPYRASVRPGTIVLACADNGWGVEHMAWGDWSSSAAAGQGTFWEKLCKPNCAEGKIGMYPVTVTLSAVKPSSRGPWFSQLSVTFTGQRPPGIVPPSFALNKP
jgi:hypothetical protein